MLMERLLMSGLTGSFEKDGILTPIQQLELERLQNQTAAKIINKLNALDSDSKFPMVAMATGFGKGRIIHKVIAETKKKRPNARILLIAGTKNILVEQTHVSLNEHQERDYFIVESDNDIEDDRYEIESELIDPSFSYKTGQYKSGADVEITTIQKIQIDALKNGIHDIYDLVIVDEVHNIGTSKRKQIIDQFHKVIGFTATAYRHSGQLKSPEEYGFEIIDSLTLPEAQSNGFLPPLIGLQIDTAGLVDKIPTSLTGNINYTELEKILKKSSKLRPYLADRLSTILRTDKGIYKTIIAVNYIWEAQEMAVLLNEKDFRVGLSVNQSRAREIHSDLIPSLNTTERFLLPSSDKDAIEILISPYVAAEGFDAPFTEALVWASPTDSPVRYTQYTGRLARRAPGKLFGVVIDALYQTKQFNYSMNFGMWMKDDVKVLSNGLFYLGPETKISEIGQTLAFDQLNLQQKVKRSYTKFEITTREPLLPIQDGEIVINREYLLNTYIAGDRLSKESREAISIISEYYPDYFIERAFGRHRVKVMKDPNKYNEVMIDMGAKQKEPLLPPQEGEIPIISEYIIETFVGQSSKIIPIARECANIIEEFHPDYFKTRIVGVHQILTMEDAGKYLEVMQDMGVELKEKLLPIQNGEIAINQLFNKNNFHGGHERVRASMNEAVQIISEFYPNYFQKRINGTNRLLVTSDAEKYIEVMQDLGVIKRMVN